MRSNTRPLLIYTILIVVVMVSLGILLAQLTRTYFISFFEERIEHEHAYFVDYLQDYDSHEQLDEAEFSDLSEQFNSAMFIFNQDNQLVLDTSDVLDEVTEEEKNQITEQVTNQSHNQRGTLIDDVFYYPSSIQIGNETATLVLASPVHSLGNITKNIWLLIGVTLFFGILLIYFIGYNIFSKYIKPIRSASSVASRLAQGDYKARTYEGYFGEAGELSQSINILARNLQEMTSAQGMQENRLEAVINNMGSGLVLIDERGYILLVNRAFLDSLGGEEHEYVSYIYYDVIPYDAVHQTVQDVYMFEETISHTFVAPFHIQRKHLNVTGAPIFSESHKWKGVVLVFHDITELKQLEQMRKDFVANVSHELKTPITSIRGFSETLLDGAMKDEQMLDQFLRIILKESGRLQSLIQDLLELSRLEKEDFQLDIERFDFVELVEETVPLIEQHAKQKSLKIQKDISASAMIEGDSGRLKQVILNLLTNAVNYTPEHGEIGIRIVDGEADVTLSITDTGVGMPQEEISRIFERFYRVDKARSRNSGGTGLGLAIVKHIVEAHQGSIEVVSAPDAGTTFHITLPKKFTEH
ncbi:two-component system histidine kinase PnpS [Thalassobacillus sp. CUG 92003]|uniref:two-component system histidine kinase PnpS n=1 Tax=Thalassobacillus sp. CUG 92003 TaxID=2736641 RepID=UPI0015E7963E|nr:ATP-binding protein [Thalassobacillus sp. CUG 92003]